LKRSRAVAVERNRVGEACGRLGGLAGRGEGGPGLRWLEVG